MTKTDKDDVDPYIDSLKDVGGGSKDIWIGRWKRYENNHKYPPWMDRKNKEYLINRQNPGLMKDIGILYLCTSESVVELKDTIIDYFIDHYHLSPELAESWVAAAATGDDTYLNPDWQFDGINFSDNVRISQIDENIAYKSARHVNLRIGRSASKDD